MKYAISSLSLVLASMMLTGCETSTATENAELSSVFAEIWNSGQSPDEPEFHVQKIDEDTLALRQSLRTTFEAPFLYLIFGDERALLIDTGVEGVDLRTVVESELTAWATANETTIPELVVMHSHGHSDHKGGDSQFSDRPDTTVISLEAEAIETFFEIENWPDQNGSIDLGNRVLEIIPTPGHTDAHVMVYDASTQILFSGDTVYPGRLYFQCGKAQTFQASIDRLVDYAAGHDIKWVLGAHIEMKNSPGQTFRQDRKSRKGEHVLELPSSILVDIQNALQQQDGQYTVQAFDSFMLFPHPANPAGMSPPNWCLTPDA